MRARLKHVLYVFMADEFAGERLKHQYKMLQVVFLVVGVIAAVLGMVNWFQRRYVVFVSLCLAYVMFMLSYHLVKKHANIRAATTILMFTVGVLFTYYLIDASNEGVAVLWLLTMPNVAMFVLGFKNGTILTLFFQLVLMFCFWGPPHVSLHASYSEIFLSRFPILYGAMVLAAMLPSFSIKSMQLEANEHSSQLQAAVQAEHDAVSRMTLQTITSICRTVDAKDAYTHQHSERVADYACMIAEDLGWNAQQLSNLRSMARLHDIGKIGVPDALLKKTSALTKSEYEAVQRHASIGGIILQDLDLFENLNYGALYHHERYDGCGYPEGLKGKDIPVEGRIIAIADAFDAMNSDRVYRKKLDPQYILQELETGRGLQFDPELTDIFLARLKKSPVDGGATC